MTRAFDINDELRVVIIEDEPARECELCHTVAECRPYGPRGEQICYECAMKNKETTDRQMARLLYGEETH